MKKAMTSGQTGTILAVSAVERWTAPEPCASHILAFATHSGEELMSRKYKSTMQLDMRPRHVRKLWDFSFSARTEAERVKNMKPQFNRNHRTR